jgi:hypothetical protein
VHQKGRGRSFLRKCRVRTEKGAVFSWEWEGLVCQDVGVKHVTQIPRTGRPLVFYQFIYLFIYYFPSQNFQVGGLAIIHKRKWATSSQQK